MFTTSYNFKKVKKLKNSLELDNWARNLLQFNSVKDKRNKERLSFIVKGFAKSSTGIISEAFVKERDRDGVYNFIEKDKREKNPLSYEMISHSYSLDTATKCLEYDTILAIQDTTSFNYKGLFETDGLGYIWGKDTRGIQCHSTIALTEDGIPIGILGLKM